MQIMAMNRSFKCSFSRVCEDWRIHGRSWGNRAFWAMAFFRTGQWILQLRPSPLRSLLNAIYVIASTFAPVITGVALDRNTQIGRCLHLIHPGMILIHPRAVIGNHVGIMHGVTLGVSPTFDGLPTIGDKAFLGAHATILGGVKIGDGAKIAANSLVVCDVPPGATAIGVPAKVYPAVTAGFQAPQRRTIAAA